MSSIIETVSYKKEDAKSLTEKLGEHLGVHNLQIYLINGECIEGIVSEVGTDYVAVIEGNSDTVIPISKISFFRYLR